MESNNARAFWVTGIACVDAGASAIRVVGNYTGSNSCITPAPTTGIAPFADPLASLVQPAFPTHCDYTNMSFSSSVRTLNPGVYCGGITISSSVVTFNPGTYIMVGGGLTASSSGTVLTGSNVTFYNTACGAGLSHTVCPTGTASYDGSYGPLSISGGLDRNAIGSDIRPVQQCSLHARPHTPHPDRLGKLLRRNPGEFHGRHLRAAIAAHLLRRNQHVQSEHGPGVLHADRYRQRVLEQRTERDWRSRHGRAPGVGRW